VAGGDGEASGLHGTRQALQERLVVLHDQERAVGMVGQFGGGQVEKSCCQRSPRYGAARGHLQSRKKAEPARRNTAAEWLTRWFAGRFLSLEAIARPYDLHHGPVIGKGPVGKRDFRASALQESPGDEDAKPEAAAVAFIGTGAARHIGFADALEHVG